MTSRELQYAGLFERAIAWMIDIAIICVFGSLIQLLLPFVGPLLIAGLYYVVLLSSSGQATIGKKVMKLRVVDLSGNQISIRTSLLRFVVSYASLLLLGLGYWFALFTDKKQTLHDLVAKTLVIRGEVAADLWTAWLDEIKVIARNIQDSLGTDNTPRSEREKLALLERLNELRLKGALTEEEFQKKKAEILL